jgi:hypothetical protein
MAQREENGRPLYVAAWRRNAERGSCVWLIIAMASVTMVPSDTNL